MTYEIALSDYLRDLELQNIELSQKVELLTAELEKARARIIHLQGQLAHFPATFM